MSIVELVDQAIAKNLIFIASKTYCPYCTRVKNVVKDWGVESNSHILELDTMSNGSEFQQELSKRSGSGTVPSVWFKGKFVQGGSEGVMNMVKDGRFKAFLEENGVEHH